MNDEQKAQRSFGLIMGLIILALMAAATMDLEASTNTSPISPPGTIVSAPFFSPPESPPATPVPMWYWDEGEADVRIAEEEKDDPIPQKPDSPTPFCFGISHWGRTICVY